MKTLTITKSKARLSKLVDEVQNGEPVLLMHGDNLAKLERFENLDPEIDSQALEAELLKAVEGPHFPYSKERMKARLEDIMKDRQRRSK